MHPMERWSGVGGAWAEKLSLWPRRFDSQSRNEDKPNMKQRWARRATQSNDRPRRGARGSGPGSLSDNDIAYTNGKNWYQARANAQTAALALSLALCLSPLWSKAISSRTSKEYLQSRR